MIDQWLVILGQSIESNYWLAPLLALLAGLLTSFTPCTLSSMPLVVGYVGGYAGDDIRKAFRYSLIFCLGMTITFTTLGVVASLLGKLMQGTGSWWYLLLGTLMVLMALQTWELFDIMPSSNAMSKNTKRGSIGALLAGLLGGLFASPCATPVLVVLLSIVAKRGNLLWGIALLVLYSIGHSLLLLMAGTSISFIRKLSTSDKYIRFNTIYKIIMGIVILAIGLYMFYLGF